FYPFPVPPHGLWKYYEGVSASVVEQFRTLAAEAGKVLAAQDGVVLGPTFEQITELGPAESFWLYRLFSNLRENATSDRQAHERFLFRSSEIGGMIERVCAASAVFCARLARRAHEHYTKREEHSPAHGRGKRAHTVEEKSSRPKKTPRQPVTRSVSRAKTVARLISELKMLKPKMFNESHYEKLERQHTRYLIFQIGKKHDDVKQWVENVRERRDVVKLAQ